MVLLVKPQFEAGRAEVEPRARRHHRPDDLGPRPSGDHRRPRVRAAARWWAGPTRRSPVPRATASSSSMRERRTPCSDHGRHRRPSRAGRGRGAGTPGRRLARRTWARGLDAGRRCGRTRPARPGRRATSRRRRPCAEPRRRRHDVAGGALPRRRGGAAARRQPRCARLPHRGRVARDDQRPRPLHEGAAKRASGISTSA